MLQSYHITMIIIGAFLLALALIHSIRWTAIGVKHGWPPPRPGVVELGKEGQ